MPADILLARKIIDRDPHASACWFRRARRIIFGRADPVTLRLLLDSSGAPPSEEQLKVWERRYARALARLTEDEQVAAVDLALDLRPKWLHRMILGIPPSAQDEADRATLIRALDKLA